MKKICNGSLHANKFKQNAYVPVKFETKEAKI